MRRGIGAPEKTAWARHFGLSKRQAQVVALRMRHRSIREAAEEIGIAESTARMHDALARAKVGVTSFPELARRAREVERMVNGDL